MSAVARRPVPGRGTDAGRAVQPVHTALSASDRRSRDPGSSALALDDAGIELAFAELKDPVRDWLIRYGLRDEIGQHRFWPTVGAAVTAYLRETGVEWVDWEDLKKRTP